jgi:uncharacterized protein YdeI (YjbR/CyaY-like superfamily)
MTPVFFSMPSEFRNWLVENHDREAEILVGFYKVDSRKPSMTWSQSVDQALCFGWIDGVRKSIDKDSYCIRFTPRKATSNWSAVNIGKVEELVKQGLMYPSGIVSFEKLTGNKSGIYSYENAEAKFTPDFEKQFKANKTAWDYFQSLASSYRIPSIHWVMSAKQESTKLKRLNELIADSAAGTSKYRKKR